jgi:hypothetical protein
MHRTAKRFAVHLIHPWQLAYAALVKKVTAKKTETLDLFVNNLYHF